MSDTTSRSLELSKGAGEKTRWKRRFCVDNRKLNALSENDVYPLLGIDDSLDALGENNHYSAMDMTLDGIG